MILNKSTLIIEVDKFITHQNNIGHSKFGAYTKPPLKNYQKEVMYQLVGKNIEIDKETPICISFNFYYPLPKSWPKKKKLANAGKYKLSSPDLTNIEKSLEDIIARYYQYDDTLHVIKKSQKKYTTNLEDTKCICNIFIENIEEE